MLSALGDEKGEKELVAGGFDVDLLYGSPETLSSNSGFAEGVSPVGDQTAVGRLELLVGGVH